MVLCIYVDHASISTHIKCLCRCCGKRMNGQTTRGWTKWPVQKSYAARGTIVRKSDNVEGGGRRGVRGLWKPVSYWRVRMGLELSETKSIAQRQDVVFGGQIDLDYADVWLCDATPVFEQRPRRDWCFNSIIGECLIPPSGANWRQHLSPAPRPLPPPSLRRPLPPASASDFAPRKRIGRKEFRRPKPLCTPGLRQGKARMETIRIPGD